MYNLIIRKQADKKLRTLGVIDRTRIAEAIYALRQEPIDNELNIRKMVGESFYRLRVGKWRIIFEKDDMIKVIAIEKIGSRGDVYK